MNRCRTCLIPDTRPDTEFVGGECTACVNYRKRAEIDWKAREAELLTILESGRNGSGYDCIVPSSGGKDSTWQTLKMIELGARPLVVTATTCMLTDIGRKNIDNLARYATTIEVTPNRTVRAKLNRIGLQMVGDVSWPEHIAIWSIPMRIACDLGIPLVMYGENSQSQYGGPVGTDDARLMTRRWVNEFGGLLGLRPMDIVGMGGIAESDMRDYQLPSDELMQKAGLQVRWLGQYIPWDSHRNAEVAIAHGMQYRLPTPANWWPWENLDNAMTGLHDALMYAKYSLGRGCAQISVDIRAGRISRSDALEWVEANDGLFPLEYMGVHIEDVCQHIGISVDEMYRILEQFSREKAA